MFQMIVVGSENDERQVEGEKGKRLSVEILNSFGKRDVAKELRSKKFENKSESG